MKTLNAYITVLLSHIIICVWLFLVASPPGILVVPLFSTSLRQVVVGDSVEFSYLIALVNSSLNATTSVSVEYFGPFNSFPQTLRLLDQGEDVYTFNISSVDLSMDGAEFALQFAGNIVLSSQVQLRVFGM